MIRGIWHYLVGYPSTAVKSLAPDLAEFRSDILPVLATESYPAGDAKRDAVRTFLASGDPGSRRTLALILWWCGAFDTHPPIDPEELKRWAGKQEIARRISALLYADPPDPTRPLFPHPDSLEE